MKSSRALRVLVVDDDPLQLRAAARLLRALGHSGALAPQGQVALDLLGQQVFDVVLLDLRMPGLDGVEILRLLRPRFPQLPVVLVSGDDLSAHWDHYRQAGASAFLLKPLDVDALAGVLHRPWR
jgi:CheY-like chemotaxis protein